MSAIHETALLVPEQISFLAAVFPAGHVLIANTASLNSSVLEHRILMHPCNDRTFVLAPVLVTNVIGN